MPPASEAVPAAVGAIKGALASDGRLQPTQQDIVRAVAGVFGADHADVDTIAALTPDDAAAAIVDAQQRHQLVQAMVVPAFVEHPPNAEHQHAINRYARSFGVDEAAVGVLHDYVSAHTKRMILDTFRAIPMAQWEHAFSSPGDFATRASTTSEETEPASFGNGVIAGPHRR